MPHQFHTAGSLACHADQRNGTFQRVLEAGREFDRDVKAMLQQDMTGYVKKTLDAGQPESVGVIMDYVDPGLTAFIKTVIEEVRITPLLSPLIPIHFVPD